MPIKRETFEQGDFNKKRTIKGETHPIVKLLSENTGLAYTVAEMSNETKLIQATVRSKLQDLKEKKLIVHKIPYFAWKRKKASKKVKKKR